ncbi:hypothetical protein CKO25_20645, partial [Thiocapsa imhoffii]
TTQGRFGRALSFNGTNSLVTVEHSASLGLSDGMTLSAWVYPTVQRANFATVMVKEISGGLSYALHADSSLRQVNTQLRIGTLTRGINAGSRPPVRAWTHLAVTHDGSTQSVYVNNVRVGGGSFRGSLTVGPNPLRIGGNTVLAGRAFEGMIDEVRIHNQALTQSELRTLSLEPVKK